MGGDDGVGPLSGPAVRPNVENVGCASADEKQPHSSTGPARNTNPEQSAAQTDPKQSVAPGATSAPETNAADASEDEVAYVTRMGSTVGFNMEVVSKV